MIVFDASAVVERSAQDRQRACAEEVDVFALSAAVDSEITEVLSRSKFKRAIPPARRELIMTILRGAALWYEPTLVVTDCRDSKDNKYLELALAAGAQSIVSSDDDLLVLHPWRGVSILCPADYLALA